MSKIILVVPKKLQNTLNYILKTDELLFTAYILIRQMILLIIPQSHFKLNLYSCQLLPRARENLRSPTLTHVFLLLFSDRTTMLASLFIFQCTGWCEEVGKRFKETQVNFMLQESLETFVKGTALCRKGDGLKFFFYEQSRERINTF